MPAFLFIHMVRKIVFGFGIVCAAILVLFIIGRITGIVQFYIASTEANEPNINIGQKFFTTNFKPPGPYKFITFKSDYIDSVNSAFNSNYKKGVQYVFRVCAEQGDIVNMRNGNLFINRNNFDEVLNLKNQFKISNKEFNLIEAEDLPETDGYNQVIQTGDSSIITCDRQLQKKYQQKIKFTSYIIADTLNGPFKWHHKNSIWTTDNFGPLQIPENCYFVLGDNRHFAQDSRYIGFIKKEDIIGVVIGK